MSKPLRFDGRVALVTGAGGGLGKQYALLLAERGAKVVVNDLGGGRSGEGNDTRAADEVVEEIRNAGGVAVADYNSVEDGEAVVKTALDNFGRLDILINNAGILRDRSFARISDQDWDLIHRVHLRGSFLVSRAAWPVMKSQKYGRIIMTSSTSGIYGNFGQANYGAAKLGLIGLSNNLRIEGQKYNIHCNAIVPMGATRLTEDVMPPEMFKEMRAEFVAPVVSWLCHEDCEDNGGIYEAGAGWVGRYRWQRSSGVMLRKGINDSVSIENIQSNWDNINEFKDTDPIVSDGLENTALYYSMIQDLQDRDNQFSQSPHSSTASSGPLSSIGATGGSKFSYEAKDVILYALSVGASVKDKDGLKFLYEGHDDFSPLPTFSIIASQSCILGENSVFNNTNGFTINLAKVLHGEQFLEILKPIPVCSDTKQTATIVEVLDKGSGAVFIINSEMHSDEGELLARGQFVIFVVGEGNFNGPRTSSKQVPLIDPPKRSPDCIEPYQTTSDQAALYRLNGDRNPLHIDPDFAALGGFKEPILHGLCSYGITARLILAKYCGNDLSLFRSIKARFAKPVIPGQTLAVSMWQEGRRIHFETRVKETNEICLTGGYVDLNGEPRPHLRSNL